VLMRMFVSEGVTMPMMLVAVLMFVFVFMLVLLLLVLVLMIGSVLMLMSMFMVMILLQMDIKLHSLNVRFFLSSRVQMIALQLQLAQFSLQLLEIDSQIQHCPDEHVSAYAAENIQVNRLHFSSPAASALIWLAAKPAPKPLLMFTTVSPLLQLLSIAS